MANKMPIAKFVSELEAALNRKDGYIMGATGQDPKKWAVNSWWFAQYSGKQHTKALYWREHAARVWDCNGLAEGLYKDYAGTNINTKARYNYSSWCGEKGSGMIPASKRVAGAAVFWSDSGAGSIHHVAYLYKPVTAGKPAGDWYLIEARGVMYGVVKTKLLSRKPNYWGLMDKYFDYGEATPDVPDDGTLYRGSKGDAVKALQEALILLGYDCGKWGADGDFGSATEQAVKAFQSDHGVDATGVADGQTLDMIKAAKPNQSVQYVQIEGGNCFVRKEPSTSSEIIGVAHKKEVYEYAGQTSANGWQLIYYMGQKGWASGKYAKLKGET